MVAVANCVGGDGLRSARAGREAEEETGFRGREGRCRGRGRLRGVARGSGRKQEVARGGKQEVAEAAWASATPRLCSSSWQRWKRTKEEEVGWAGWGGTGPAGGLHG